MNKKEKREILPLWAKEAEKLNIIQAWDGVTSVGQDGHRVVEIMPTLDFDQADIEVEGIVSKMAAKALGVHEFNMTELNLSQESLYLARFSPCDKVKSDADAVLAAGENRFSWSRSLE